MEFFGLKNEKKERGLPRHVRIRRGTADDEFPTFEAMRRTMNQEMNWAHHAPTRHHLRNSPDSSFWLAEESALFSTPKVIGYARSMVREGVWCLNEFFMLPGHQRQGIGGALLNACLKDGDLAGAHTRLVLASHHPSADSLYIRRAGCFPRLPMLLLVGSLQKLSLPESDAATVHDSILPHSGADSSPAFTPLAAEPIILTPEVQAEIDVLDREIVGYARPTEHAFWVASMGGPYRSSRLFRHPAPPGEKGRLVGYAYLGYETTGPALALDSADLPRMIHHGVNLFQRLPQTTGEFEFRPMELYFPVCGSNEIMLSWLLNCGWHIAFQYLFMSTRPLGHLDRYVCHNPLYYL
jgi:GNAT superfamily N-acetyltransferase